MPKNKNYTIRFSSENFNAALIILGFKYREFMSHTKFKTINFYRKGMHVTILKDPKFRIIIDLSDAPKRIEMYSYEYAYNKIHEIVTCQK